MAKGALNDEQLREYERNGFVLARGMFDDEETSLLRRAAREDRDLDQHSLVEETVKAGVFVFLSGTIPAIRCMACSRVASPWSIRRRKSWAARCTTTIPR